MHLQMDVDDKDYCVIVDHFFWDTNLYSRKNLVPPDLSSLGDASMWFYTMKTLLVEQEGRGHSGLI